MAGQIDVLIIDDEVRRMRATVELLEADGFMVEQESSPSQAFERLRRQPNYARVIILDIMMPPDGEFDTPDAEYGLRTGILFLDRLHELQTFRTPIIVLTASDEHRSEIERQVARYLKKPVPYGTLKGIIDELMVDKGSGRQS